MLADTVLLQQTHPSQCPCDNSHTSRRNWNGVLMLERCGSPGRKTKLGKNLTVLLQWLQAGSWIFPEYRTSIATLPCCATNAVPVRGPQVEYWNLVVSDFEPYWKAAKVHHRPILLKL
jgi:hypothetical protein